MGGEGGEGWFTWMVRYIPLFTYFLYYLTQYLNSWVLVHMGGEDEGE